MPSLDRGRRSTRRAACVWLAMDGGTTNMGGPLRTIEILASTETQYLRPSVDPLHTAANRGVEGPRATDSYSNTRLSQRATCPA